MGIDEILRKLCMAMANCPHQVEIRWLWANKRLGLSPRWRVTIICSTGGKRPKRFETIVPITSENWGELIAKFFAETARQIDKHHVWNSGRRRR